ncbi:transducin/WD40 repeat-like superfamily protein, partial [Striga asiatica]
MNEKNCSQQVNRKRAREAVSDKDKEVSGKIIHQKMKEKNCSHQVNRKRSREADSEKENVKQPTITSSLSSMRAPLRVSGGTNVSSTVFTPFRNITNVVGETSSNRHAIQRANNVLISSNPSVIIDLCEDESIGQNSSSNFASINNNKNFHRNGNGFCEIIDLTGDEDKPNNTVKAGSKKAMTKKKSAAPRNSRLSLSMTKIKTSAPRNSRL